LFPYEISLQRRKQIEIVTQELAYDTDQRLSTNQYNSFVKAYNELVAMLLMYKQKRIG